jgi:competence protein ComEC
MHRRPLLSWTVAWALGIALCYEFEASVALPFFWWIVAGLLLLAIILYHAGHPQWPLGLLLLAAAWGALSAAQARLPTERLYAVAEMLRTVRGVVVSYPIHRLERSSFVLRPQGLPGLLQVFYYHPQGVAYRAIRYGDELDIEARFQIPWSLEEFDYRTHLLTRNIWGVGTLWSGRQLQHLAHERGHPVLALGYRMRLELFEIMDRYVPDPGSGLLKGLLFGERAYLSEEVEAGFRDAGVMHLLAVSGLNVGIMVGLFWIVLRLWRLSATQIYLALLPLVFVYLVLVGFEVSLVRASLMFGFVTLGWVIAERGWILKSWIDPLQSISAAALVILLSHPLSLLDVSFQLSFAATAGIVIALQFFWPLWQEKSERWRWQWSVTSSWPKKILFQGAELILLFVLVSFAAQLAVAPIVALHFHRAYVGALVANLVVVPLATIALWLGILFLLVAAVPWSPLVESLGMLEGLLLAGLTQITQFFAHLPGAYWELGWGVQRAFLVVLPLLADVYGYFAWAISRISWTKPASS